MLQLASRFAELSGKRSYFLSAEQSPGEIRLTADRLQIGNLDRFRVLSALGGGADVDPELLKQDPPACFVVDSISALCGKDKLAAVAIAKTFKKLSSVHKAPSFLIAHMTKEHDYAGLMALQHEVDTLVSVSVATEREASKLFKEGYELNDEQLGNIRVLIAWKNRYGATGKDHFLVMTPTGLAALPPPVPKPERKAKRRGFAAPVDFAPVEAMSESDAALELPPRRRARAVPAPNAIQVAGQTLVKKPKPKKPAKEAQP
jgi:predicted ATP-dependent serine protease